MYIRMLSSRLIESTTSVLLLGPRQVGKSTLLKQLEPDLIIDLSSPSTFRSYVSRPERLEEELRAVGGSTRVVMLDEVQRVPALLDVVQSITDSSPGRFRFLLSGSSARKLRRGSANLLPGRVIIHHLHPLLARELATDFDLDRAMTLGTLPGIWSHPDPNEAAALLRSYADTYLREEIQAEALVRDLGGYSRVLDLIAACSGSILNLAGLSQDAGIRHETARRWIEILEDTLVVFRVPAWSGSDRASLTSHPRIFMFDIGVRNALLGRPLHAPLTDERGRLFEHLVAYEIYRRTRTVWPEARLFHFRTRSGAEIDFVIEVDRELWGIEVKLSNGGASRGMQALANRTDRLKRKIVVTTESRPRHVHGVEVLPLHDFLNLLPD